MQGTWDDLNRRLVGAILALDLHDSLVIAERQEQPKRRLFGPKPPRDLVGAGVDIGLDPLTYITWNNSTLYMIIRSGLGVLDDRSAQLGAVESIERSSIDFYATTRNLYRQSRAAQINDGKANVEDLPNL